LSPSGETYIYQQDFSIIQKNWDSRVSVHLSSKEYPIESFKQGNSILWPYVVQEIGNISGKEVLHLMCHFGLDSMCLARDYGANVTAIDISLPAIEAAVKLAKELNITNVNFIQSNLYDLPKNLQKKNFDLVFMTHGVLCWLPDLDTVMKIIATFLKEDGLYYLCDDHPFITMIQEKEDKLIVEEPYFFTRIPSTSLYSYAGDTPLTHPDQIEWSHSISSIINAIIKAPMKIQWLHEQPYTFWQRFQNPHIDNLGYWLPPEKFPILVPQMFSILCKK